MGPTQSPAREDEDVAWRSDPPSSGSSDDSLDRDFAVDETSKPLPNSSPGERSSGLRIASMTQFPSFPLPLVDNAVVLDHGSYMFKYGLAGDTLRVMMRSIIGTPKNPGIMVGLGASDFFLGDEALHKRGILKLKTLRSPYAGIVPEKPNVDQLARLYENVFFSHLRVDPEENRVLLTEPAMLVKSDMIEARRVLSEILCEKLRVPSLCFVPQALCSLIDSGRKSGMVVDMGYEKTDVVPVFEGRLRRTDPDNTPIVERSLIGGKRVTEYFGKLLAERGLELCDTSKGREEVSVMKERMCFVSTEYLADLQRAQEEAGARRFREEYELSDGEKIVLGSERFRAPELLFSPGFDGCESASLGSLISMCGERCSNRGLSDGSFPEKFHLYKNIVLAGGTSMFEGIAPRILADTTIWTRHKVAVPQTRKYSSWRGASLFSSLSYFEQCLITKSEFQEHGTSIFLKKDYF